MFTKARVSQFPTRIDRNEDVRKQITPNAHTGSPDSHKATVETRIDRAVLISHSITLTLIVIALIVFLITPVLAISWSKQPFPGFVVEHTLVIANISGTGWSGPRAGLNYPQRVISVEGVSVTTPAQFTSAISDLPIGSFVEIQTESQDDTIQSHPLIALGKFAWIDMARLFWLPYGVGLVYLMLGIWIYHVRGNTRAGRAFADFCASAAIMIALTFDLSTTHVGAPLWTVSLAVLGSTLISLALVFPKELGSTTSRAWLNLLLYSISGVLAIWGALRLYSRTDPWEYVQIWRTGYMYAALGTLVFLGMQVIRVLTSPPGLVKQQARIILWGSLLAFFPLVIWFTIPQILNLEIPWNPVLFLPLLLIFLGSIGLAILRYRLWDIDLLIRRTLLYTLLTLILAALYWLSVLAIGLFLRDMTDSNRLATILAIPIIAILADPIRKRVQNTIDRRFYRQKYDAEKTMEEFIAGLRDDVNIQSLSNRLQTMIQETLQPEEISLWLYKPRKKG
jgi:hypothetical protein